MEFVAECAVDMNGLDVSATFTLSVEDRTLSSNDLLEV